MLRRAATENAKLLAEQKDLRFQRRPGPEAQQNPFTNRLQQLDHHATSCCDSLHQATDGVFGRDRRLPARSIENLVVENVRKLFEDQLRLMEALHLDEPGLEDMERLKRFTETTHSKTFKEVSVANYLHRVTVFEDKLQIDLDTSALREGVGLGAVQDGPKTYRLAIPVKLQRRGIETKIVIRGNAQSDNQKSSSLIKLIARSADWFERLKSGEKVSLEEIAKGERMSASDVSRYLPLAFLAPDIVESIAKGKQPIELTVQRIKRLSPLPSSWQQQRRILGFAA
jgi:site-specific DNA recombinase